MTDETLEVCELTILNLVNRAIALRTSDWDLVPRRFARRTIGICLILHNVPSVWRFRDIRGLAVRELNEKISDFPKRQAKIDIDHLKRVARHVRRHGFARILNDGNAATRFDSEKTGRTIIAPAAEHDAHHVGTMLTRSTAKQDIDRRAMPVFSRGP